VPAHDRERHEAPPSAYANVSGHPADGKSLPVRPSVRPADDIPVRLRLAWVWRFWLPGNALC
jgi:hypothetical protein